MADIPMNTLEKVVYKNVELNAFNVASCKWRKPYNITIPTDIAGIEKITVTRSESESNCGQLDVTSITASGTVLYGDTLSVEATAETGYKNPTASFTGGVSNNKVTGNVTVTASATALTKITLTKNTHVKTISLRYIDGYTETSKTVTAAGTYYAKNGSDYSWSATADDYCYMTDSSAGGGILSGDITISPKADYGYYTVSLGAITNATAYVNTSASNYASSVTAKYGSKIYMQVKPNNCYVYIIDNRENYTPSSPYTDYSILNSVNFTVSSTTPATSPTASNIPTAIKNIGGSVRGAYYKVTLTVTNGTVTSGATTTIQYGNSISYTAKGNSKYYYVNKTTGGYGDSGYSTTYTPTSSILPADGSANADTAVAVSHNVGSCTAYKTYTIRSANASCYMYTYVKSAHALGETSFTSMSTPGSKYTVYETDVFYSYGYATNMGGYKMTEYSCTNNGVTVSPTSYNYLTVSGSGSNTSWTTTTSSTASTGILYRVYFGTSTSPKTINGNVGIAYAGAALQYTYYGYNSNIYSSKINSGTTYVNIYDSSKVSTAPPRLAYYPASAIRIDGCICLQADGTNSAFSSHPLTTTKTANLKYASISGTASMGNQGPASGNSGTAQRQYLSVSKKAGAYKFYIRIWGLSIPS